MIQRLMVAGCSALLATTVCAVESEPLPPDLLSKAIQSDAITIPTPGELFAALAKPGKINWASQYREPIPTSYRNRAQIALNLGGLIADGFIAVEAQDSQQVKNIGADIMKLAKSLGVSEQVLGRGSTINDFAENGEWSALQEELEATQNEVKAAMQSQDDQDLIILVSLGGWIRGTHVVTSTLLPDYKEETARVLRQPALVKFIQNKISDMSPTMQNEELVKKVRGGLNEVAQIVSFPIDQGLPVEDVRRLNELVSNIMSEIQKKETR